MRTAAVVLAVVVVLAGCSALQGGDEATPEPTSGVTATPTTTPRPIGLSASGVTDPYQLRTAHIRVLAGQSYTYDYGLTVSWAGRTRGRVAVSARVAANRSRMLLERTVQGEVPSWLLPVGSTLRYDAGTTAYVRDPETGTTSVEQSPPGATVSDTYTHDIDSVYLLLSDVDTAVTGTETVDGRTLYVVTGTTDLMEVAAGVARNVSVRAAVAPSGLVVDFRAAYDLRRETPVGGGRSRVHVVYDISYAAVGNTTVPRPDWAVGSPGGDGGGAGPDADRNGTSNSPVTDDVTASHGGAAAGSRADVGSGSGAHGGSGAGDGDARGDGRDAPAPDAGAASGDDGAATAADRDAGGDDGAATAADRDASGDDGATSGDRDAGPPDGYTDPGPTNAGGYGSPAVVRTTPGPTRLAEGFVG